MRACGAQHLSSCCSLRCLVCTAWCASSGCTTSFCAGLRPLQFEQQLEASLRKKKQQERLNEERERRKLQQQQQQKEQQQQQEQQQRRAAGSGSGKAGGSSVWAGGSAASDRLAQEDVSRVRCPSEHACCLLLVPPGNMELC